MSHFHVQVLQGHKEWAGPRREELSRYLHQTFTRFSRDGYHCEVRVCTCRAWKKSGGVVESYALRWGEEAPPGEEQLDRLAGTASPRTVERIEREFAAGDAIRLFMFNGDAHLCFEEILSPLR